MSENEEIAFRHGGQARNDVAIAVLPSPDSSGSPQRETRAVHGAVERPKEAPAAPMQSRGDREDYSAWRE